MTKAKIGPSYTAVYQLDSDGNWLVEILAIPQVHTFGRTLSKAEANIRDALALWLDVQDADGLTILPDYRIDPVAIAAVTMAKQARHQAMIMQEAAAASAVEAAHVLIDDLHISLRDAAHLLAVSHQRVQQLAQERRSRGAETTAATFAEDHAALQEMLERGRQLGEQLAAQIREQLAGQRRAAEQVKKRVAGGSR